MLTLTKLEIAELQLKRALELFLRKEDYVSAITLAGASEEILGKLRVENGDEHALGNFVGSCVRIGRVVFNEEWPPSLFADMANHFRNGLKHITDGSPMSIPREAAIEIIDRAVENYWALVGDDFEEMREYLEVVHGG